MPSAAELMVEVGADTSGAEQGLNELGDKAGGSGGWAGKIATVGAAAFAAVGAAAVGVIGKGVMVAGDMEQAKVGFETMLGSGQQADAFLVKLQAFAAKTPFEFPELQESASRLLAVGVNADHVIPLMTALGDATAGMGTGSEGISRAVAALQKMQTSGKVSAETMQQLAEAGIPAWDALAAKLGTDVAGAQDQVSKGAVKVGDLMASIETKAGPGFQRLNGMMDKQSATFGGMVSTLKDSVTMGLADLGKPVMEALKGAIGPVSDTIGATLKAVGPSLAELGTSVVGALQQLLPAVVPLVQGLVGALAPVVKSLGPVFAALVPVLASVAGTFGKVMVALSPALGLLGPIAQIIGKVLAGALKLAEPLIAAVGKVLAILAPVLEVILQALSPIIDALVAAFMPVVEALAPVIGTLGGALGQVLLALVPILPPLLQLIVAFTPLLVLAAQLIGLMATGLAPILVIVAEALSKVVGVLASALVPIVDRVTALLQGNFTAAFEGLGTLLSKVGAWFAELPGKVMAVLADLPGKLNAWALGAVTRIMDAFWAGLPKLVAFWFELPGTILRLLVTLGPKLVAWWWDTWNGLVRAAWEALPGLLGFVGSIPGKVLGALSDLVPRMLGIGKDVVVGLWNGLLGMQGWLADRVKEWAKAVLPGPLEKLLGIHSPSTVAAGITTNFGLGLLQGLEGMVRPVSKASAALGDAAASAITMPGLTASGPGGARAGAIAGMASSASSRPAGSATTVYNVVNVHAAGSILTDRDLEELMRSLLIRTGQANAGGILGGQG